MRKLIILTLVFLISGCVTGPQLVSARFKPVKKGIIKMPTANSKRWEKEYKADAAKLMATFCQPLRGEIIEINMTSTPSGATHTALGGSVFSDTTFETASYVHFDCVDESVGDL
jgi:hypothetical protein